jgi:hypothetical protein
MVEGLWCSDIPYVTDEQGVMRFAVNFDGDFFSRFFILMKSQPTGIMNAIDYTSYYCQLSLGEMSSGPVYFTYRHAEPW